MSEKFRFTLQEDLDLIIIEFSGDIGNHDVVEAFNYVEEKKLKNVICDYSKSNVYQFSIEELRKEMMRTIEIEKWRDGGFTILVSDKEQDRMIFRMYTDMIKQTNETAIVYHITDNFESALSWLKSRIAS